jgi:hypothetical protein
MKNKPLYFLFFALLIVIFSCSKEDENDRFELLTGTAWVSDSLLVDGQDASGPGEILEKFKGEAKFNRDATGTFGQYSGNWRFAEDRTAIIITTDSLPIPLSTWIEELTDKSLKIKTAYPSLTNPEEDMDIRMTFKAK